MKSIPTIPPIPGNVDPVLRPILQALRDAATVRFGQSRNQLDRSPTMRELIDQGLLVVRAYDSNGNPQGVQLGTATGGTSSSSGGGGGASLFDSTIIPAPPVNLTAAATPTNIILSWAFPNPTAETVTAFTEVWSSDVNNRQTAVLLGIGRTTYIHSVEPNTTRYYWVRFVTYAGLPSEFNALAGTAGTTPLDPTDLLELLSGALSESQLAQDLAARIDLIDVPISGLLDRVAQLQTDVQTPVSGLLDMVADLHDTVDDEVDGLVTRVNELRFQVQDQADGLLVRVHEVEDDLNTATSGLKDRVSTLQGQVQTATTGLLDEVSLLKSQVQTATTGLLDRTTALTTDLNDLAADVLVNAQDISAVEAVVYDATGGVVANASAISALDARVDTAEGTITSHATQLSSINATLPNKADVSALSALDTRVTSAEGTITAQGQDITALETTVYDPTGGVAATASGLTALTTRVTDAEGDISAAASDITALETTVNHPTTGVAASAGAITALDTRVTTAEGTISTHTSQITTLEAAVETLDGFADAAALQQLQADVAYLDGEVDANSLAITSLTTQVTDLDTQSDANSTAITSLNSRVTTAEGTISTHTSQITYLNGMIETLDGFADAEAMTALTARVTVTEGDISALTSDVTALETTVYDVNTGVAANASAIGVLESDVSAIDGVVTAHSSELTSLDSRLDTAEGSLTTQSSAISGLDTRVTSAEGTISAHSSELTSLDSRLDSAEGGISANAGAISALDTRVISAEGTISAHSSELTSLDTRLDTAEGSISTQSSAISSLDSRVTATEGVNTAQSSSITSLDSRVTAAEGVNSTQASAISSLDTRVQQTESTNTAQASSITALNSAVSAPNLAQDLFGNANFTRQDLVDNRPWGVKASTGTTIKTTLSYADANKSILRCYSATDTSIGFTLPAFRVDPSKRYRAAIRYRMVSGTKNALGFYVRAYTKTTELVDGATHLSATAGEAGVDTGGTFRACTIISATDVAAGAPGAFIGSSMENRSISAYPTDEGAPPWFDLVVEFAPLAGTIWASLTFMNWTGLGFADLQFDRIFIYEDTSATATAITDLSTRVTATETTNTSQATQITSLFASNPSDAKALYTDPTFANGNNSVTFYNNAGGGTVTIVREAKQADSPFAESAFNLKITTTGTASPGLGGFVQGTMSRPNAVFLQRFVAKIPVGYTLSAHSNSIGTGGASTWLTSQAGTGKFQEYVVQRRCGDTGTFSTTGHIALNGTPAGTVEAPVSWYLAYATVFDATAIGGSSFAQGTASAVNALDSRVTQTEADIISVASDVTALDVRIDDAVLDISGNASAISTLDSRVSQTENDIDAQASDITLLDSRLDTAEGNINSTSTALGALTTRVTSVEGVNSSQATSITSLNTRVTDAEGINVAQGTAISTLQTDVQVLEGSVSVNTSDIVSLDSRLDTAEGTISGQATAISGLDTRVTATEGSISSQASDITALDTRLDTAEGNISGNATAISGLQTSVSTINGTLSTQASDITALDTRLDTAEGTITGQGTAISTLQTDVSTLSGTVSVHTSDITSLDGRLDTAEGTISAQGTAISGLSTDLQSLEGTVSVHTSDITALDGRLDTAEGTISGHTTAISGLTTDLQSAEGSILANSQDITALESRVTDTETTNLGQASAITTLNTNVGLIDGRVTASATDITTLNAVVSAPNMAVDLSGNPNMTRRDLTHDRPWGPRATHGTSVPTTLSYADAGRTILRSYSATDSSLGFCFPAFRVDPNKRYRAYIRYQVTAGTIAAGGFYVRFYNKTTDLAAGTTHVGTNNVGEAGVDVTGNASSSTARIISASDTGAGAPGSAIGGWMENRSVTALNTWYELVVEYTPANDVLWASLGVLNWTGWGLADLRIDRCYIFESGQHITDSITAVSTQISNVSTTVNGHTTSIEQNTTSINGLSGTYTVKIDNNGHVSGFGLASDWSNGVPTSQFIVAADRFAVAAPGASSFGLIVEGGKVVMDGAYIKNATIPNAAITDLAATKITAGSINVALTLQAGTIELPGTGYIYSAKTAYGSTTPGWFIGRSGSEAAVDIGTSTQFLRFKPTTGLQVGGDIIATGNIKANAVTAGVSTAANGPIELLRGNWVTVVTSPVLNAYGGPVFITANAARVFSSSTVHLYFRIRRTVIATGVTTSINATSAYMAAVNAFFPLTAQDLAPGTGEVQYLYQIYWEDGPGAPTTARVYDVSIFALETKR